MRGRIVVVVAFALLGCKPAGNDVTIQSLMADIDRAADTIWAAASTTETAAGAITARPRNKAAWDDLAVQADMLLRAGDVLHHRPPVASPDAQVADAHVTGTRTVAQIANDIASDPAAFEARVALFEASARDVRRAIAAQDSNALLASGERLDASCDSCHRAYWHPRVLPPAMPSPDVFARSRP